MAKRSLHPALQQRAQQVKAAHETLKSDPAYQQASGQDKFKMANAHVAKTKQG